MSHSRCRRTCGFGGGVRTLRDTARRLVKKKRILASFLFLFTAPRRRLNDNALALRKTGSPRLFGLFIKFNILRFIV